MLVLIMGKQIIQKFRIYLKILSTRRVTQSKVQFEDLQIFITLVFTDLQIQVCAA